MNFVRTAVLLALATTLVGCADTPLLSGKKAPDELAVIEGPPLYLPPSFDVRPPSEMNPTLAKEASTEEKAQEIITGNKSAPATTATDGFLYIPKMSGAPTGVPTAKTGYSPVVHDQTNSKLCVYDSGDSRWECVAVAP